MYQENHDFSLDNMYTYLSLNYFATFWIILNYDWFKKELGAALSKNVASHYGHDFNPDPSITSHILK